MTGTTPAALQAYERALAAFLGWRGGTEEALAQALQQAPGFVMAHLLQGYLLVCGRDPRRVGLARPVLARAAALRANSRERRHLAALAAAIDGDYEAAKAHLGDVLDTHPRDALALHVAHAFDYVTGDIARLHDRVTAVLPAWSADLPGYHAVLAMHAFGLEECGEYERAEEAARDALAQNPANARAHHVMAHVFEMTGRTGEGLRWMNAHIQCWVDSLVSTHCWWHLALFHLAQGEADRALALYDRRVSAAQADDIADLIDAAALLWRLQLEGSTDTPCALARAGRRVVAAHRRRLLQLQRHSRHAGLRRRTRLAARPAAGARAGGRAVLAHAAWRDHAPTRPAGVSRADRLRPR